MIRNGALKHVWHLLTRRIFHHTPTATKRVERVPKRRNDEGGLQRFFRSIVGFDNTGTMPDARVTAGTTVWAGLVGGL